MKNLVFVIFLGLSSVLNAQGGLGTIKGKLYTSDSTTVKPFTIIKMEVNGNIIGVKTDIDGKYEFKDVKTGIYNLKVKRDTNYIVFSGVEVNSDQITMMNLYMPPKTIKEVVIIVDKPKVDVEHVEKISLTDINHSPNKRNPMAMIKNKMSEVSVDQNNQMIIRGSRAGDVIYYVDGVKMTSLQSLPGASIRGMMVYTGGVPAKYGDTMGGVVILETKSYFDLYYQWKAQQ